MVAKHLTVSEAFGLGSWSSMERIDCEFAEDLERFGITREDVERGEAEIARGDFVRHEDLEHEPTKRITMTLPANPDGVSTAVFEGPYEELGKMLACCTSDSPDEKVFTVVSGKVYTHRDRRGPQTFDTEFVGGDYPVQLTRVMLGDCSRHSKADAFMRGL